MAEEILKDDELIDSTEVVGDDPKPKLTSGEDLLDKAVSKNAINTDFILEKSYAIDPIKGKEIMGDAFLPHKSDFQDLFKVAQENHEINLAKQKAEDQGIIGEFGGFVAQAAAEIVGGTVEGLGYLADFQSMTDGTFGEGNWFSALGTGLKDWTREVAPVHVDPETQGKFAPWSSEWWFSNLPSVASAISIMIPVAGWARGVGMIGKGVGLAAKGIKGLNYTAKAGKAAKGLGGLNNIDDAVRAGMQYQDKFSKIYNSVAKSRTLNAVHQGIVSRHIESNMEAAGVYKEEYDKVLAETGDIGKARLAASEAAAFSYKGNSIMLLQDIPQYFLLGRGMKATRAFNGRAQMKAAGQSGTKGALQSTGRYISDMASEFGEEAYQFVIGEEAMHFGDVMAGIAEDKNFSSRFGEYVSDGEFWTSGFFGAIGAGVMQGTKPVFDKIRGKTVEDSRIKELEERGTKFAYHNKKLRAAAESGLPEIYEQAMLDASTDMAVNAAKEGNIGHYKKQLEDLKSADPETREKMGVDETFVENIDRLISDANAIEKIWNKNERRFDPSILPQVVQSKFAISKLDGDRGKLINQINEDRNNIHKYNELSADGKNVFDAKLKIKAAENGVVHAKKILEDKSRKLTEEQKERIQEYINQQEAIISTANEEINRVQSDDAIVLPEGDKDILKLLDNEAIIGEAVSNMEKLSWQDQLIDAHIMRLNKLTNREIVGEAAKHKANLDKGREDFRRVQDLYTQIHKGAKEETIGKRKTIGVDEKGKPIKEESDDYEDAEKLTQRYEVELTPEEKQNIINEAKEILARTTDETDKENIAKMIEKMESIVKDEVSRFQQQEKAKAKALQELIDKKLAKIKRLNAVEKGKITKQIAEEIALAYDQYSMIDHAYDNTPLAELFFKDTDTLQVFHNGEKGILYKTDDTNEVVFQSSSSGKELIINGSIEDTVSDLNLGISKDSYFPVDITVTGDTMSIWIGDSELSHIGTMPQESLNYDKAGNLKSVTLVNGKGEEVEITGEILMYEVADMLLVYQLAIEQFLGKDQTFTIGGKEYQIGFNASNTMQSKVFEVLRDEKGEILMTEEVLPGKRNIYNKDGSLNKKGRILNEITDEFREQLIKDIVGYTEGDTQFAPRIQKERETVREYVERGEGPLAKRKGETNEEYALRTGDTSKIKVANRESEILKLQKKLEDPNITEEERTATLEKISQERQQQKEDEQRKAELASKSRYAIKGTNKWILKEQNEEVTDTEDVPTEPPGGPTDEKGPDETKPKGESTKNPKTEEEITDQFIDPDISEADLLAKAISKVFKEFEPTGSKLTEELKNAESIEDLQGLLNKKTEVLSSTSNVTEATVDSEGDPVMPFFGAIIGEGEVIPASADDISLNSEEKEQLESDIERIKNFISKVKTEFTTIKDEAIRAQLEAEEKLKRESTVLIDEDVEIGDVIIELTSNPKGLEKVEENGNRFYKDSDGNMYIGMSSIVNPSDFVDEKGEWTGAAPIGTAVDSVLRNFFAGKPTEYTGEIAKRMSEEAYNELLKTAEEFKESLKDEDGSLDHIEFLTEGLFIANNDIKASQEHIDEAIEDPKLRKGKFGIATEMDMVIVNKKTNTVELVDFKTVRLGRYTIPENKLKKEWDGKSKKDGYTKQQNGSRIILELNTGIKFEALSLLPIGLEYNKNDQQTSEAKVSSELMPLDKLDINEVFPEEYAKQILKAQLEALSKTEVAAEPTTQTSEVKKGDIVTPNMIVKDNLSVIDGEFIGDIIQEGNTQGKNTKVVKVNESNEKGISVDIRIVTNDGVLTATVFIKPTQQPSEVEGKQPEPSFELESTEPAADTRKSKSTQQDAGRIDGSIETKTYAFKTKEKPVDNKKTERLLIFDAQGNPIPRKDLGVSINTDILSNPNLMKEGAKIFLQPLRNDYFRDNFENNDQIADTNYFESIPIIVYINDENGNKVPIAILKATGATEKELQLRKAVYDNWVNQEQSGYMIGELQLTSNDTVVNMTAGQNLRRVTNDENKSVVKPLAERWTAGYQFDDSGNIVLRKNDQLEFKFGIVNKPREGQPSVQFPSAEDSNLDSQANQLRPEISQAGQIYGAVLNGNGDYIFPKLSTSDIDNKAVDIILGILKSGEKVTIEDIKKIQKIIFVEYENDTIIEKVETITGYSDDTVNLITINWNRKSKKPYVTFMNNGKVYSIDVEDLNEKEPKSIRRKKVVRKGDENPTLTVDNSIEPKDVLTELKKTPIKIIENIIKKKKYNVSAENLNSREEYASPITGKIYKTYNDYLIGRPDINETPNTEVDQGRSILQTDIQPSDGGNYFYDMQIQVGIGEQMFEKQDSEIAEKVTTPTDETSDETSDKTDSIDWGSLDFEDTSGIVGIPSMSPSGRFNMFLNKFNIQLSGFSSMKPGKVSRTTQQFKNEAKVFGLEGRVSKNGSLYLYDPSTKKPLVKANSPSNNPNFKLNLNRLTPVKSKYPYESTRVSSGRTISQLGINPLDWATLTVKEKENIIKCK